MAVTELHKASTLGENHSTASRRYIIDRSTMRTSTLRKMWRDRESEGRIGEDKRRCPEKPYLCSSKCEIIESEDTSRDDANEIENECPQNQNQIQNQQPDDNRLHLHRSPSLDFPAKERVRKVFRDWGSKSFEGRTVYTSRMNNFSRAESLEENECKRVRIEIGCEIEQVVDLGVGGKRSIRRIYGRQAVLDLLAKFVRERETEVECLLENRFVSNFAHRQRIQSLLKGRFLRNQRFVEDEKQTSIAASELGLLRQSHSVSDIRKGFLSKSNNVEHVLEVKRPDSGDDIKYEEITDEFNEKFPNPQETFSEISHETEKLPAKNQEDSDSLNWQHVVISHAQEDWHESVTEDDDSQWRHLTSDEGIDVNSPLTTISQESNPEWYKFGGNSNAFDWSDDDDDNDRKYELAQLTNRRTVSNLLQSDFGPKLNNLLMQSYIKRQNQAFDNESENEGVDSFIPFPQTQQQEKEIINGLRIDIDNLHQRMNEMQRMLEACMNMQLQLQQSVHQQLNSALNQSSCHLCCDNRFQSLPDRCGAHNHMYICSNCVEKINWSTVKESVRHP